MLDIKLSIINYQLSINLYLKIISVIILLSLCPLCLCGESYGFWNIGMAAGPIPTPTPTPTPTPSPTPSAGISYNIIDLGTLGGSESDAMAIDNMSHIAGYSTLSNNETYHAFLYVYDETTTPTGMVDIGTLGYMMSQAYAYDININGHIVGESETTSNTTHAFLFADSEMQDLGILHGDSSFAHGMNDDDVIVGYSSSTEGTYGFTWSYGVMNDLQLSITGYSYGAEDINNLGTIVGWISRGEFQLPFVHQDDETTTIGVAGSTFGSANAINDLGHVTGVLDFPDTSQDAFLYKEGTLSDLGTLGGYYSEGFDINIDDMVVGESSVGSDGLNHAFLFIPEKWIMYDLNSLIPVESGWELRCAHGINDKDEIVGWGIIGGYAHAFLLVPLAIPTPTPTPTPTSTFTPTPTPSVPGPHLVRAIFNDANGNGIAEQGEMLTLVFDQGVTITKSLITPSCFYLSVAGDSLGNVGFNAFINHYSSHKLGLILGQGAHLTIQGKFSAAVNQSGSPSGIDLSVARPAFAIRSLDGLVDSIDLGNPNSDDAGLDIEYSFRPGIGNIGPGGGIIDNSGDPDAAYQYSLYIPGGALSTIVQFIVTTPIFPTPQPGCDTIPPPDFAIQILADVADLNFLTSATLTLHYIDGDVDIDNGFAEAGMRIYMCVLGCDGCWRWLPVPGQQIVDTENNTVTVHLGRLNYSCPTGGMRLASLGDSGIFGNLPGSTIEESTINIKPQGGGMVRILSGPTLNAGVGGCYTYHQIEFPNYVETDPSDPNVIKVTIKQAVLADRIARSGGNSFPTASNALFVVLTKNYSNVGVPFNSPVNIRVQFMDGTANAFNDIWKFDNTAGAFGSMALVKDILAGTDVDFQFITGVTQSIMPVTGGGYVAGSGITGLTDSQGKGVWGAVTNPSQPTPTPTPTPTIQKVLWMVY